MQNTSKNAPILLPLNWNFSGLCITDFLKPVGQGDFGAHSEANLVSQFMQTTFFTLRNVPKQYYCFKVNGEGLYVLYGNKFLLMSLLFLKWISKILSTKLQIT